MLRLVGEKVAAVEVHPYKAGGHVVHKQVAFGVKPNADRVGSYGGDYVPRAVGADRGDLAGFYISDEHRAVGGRRQAIDLNETTCNLPRTAVREQLQDARPVV